MTRCNDMHGQQWVGWGGTAAGGGTSKKVGNLVFVARSAQPALPCLRAAAITFCCRFQLRTGPGNAGRMGQSMSFGLTQLDVDELLAFCKGACECFSGAPVPQQGSAERCRTARPPTAPRLPALPQSRNKRSRRYTSVLDRWTAAERWGWPVGGLLAGGLLAPPPPPRPLAACSPHTDTPHSAPAGLHHCRGVSVHPRAEHQPAGQAPGLPV